MLSAVVVAMAAPQGLNAQGAQVGNPGYGDALRQLTEQQQNYFGRRGSFQFADGVCRVVQEGHRTQIISFGADETGYYTELDFEEPVNGAPVYTEKKPTIAAQNHLSNIFNMYTLLNGNNAATGDMFGKFDNFIDAECRITYKETGKTEVMTIKSTPSGGFRSTVKFV